WVLLLRDRATRAPVGFSTQVLMDVRVEGVGVRALFSGDTVIHREYWGSQELTRTWLRFAGQQLPACGGRPFYCLLRPKAHRPDLSLPLLLPSLFPGCAAAPPPSAQKLIEVLAPARCPGAFHPSARLIDWQGDPGRLRPALDSSPRRLRNPHVRFF